MEQLIVRALRDVVSRVLIAGTPRAGAARRRDARRKSLRLQSAAIPRNSSAAHVYVRVCAFVKESPLHLPGITHSEVIGEIFLLFLFTRATRLCFTRRREI